MKAKINVQMLESAYQAGQDISRRWEAELASLGLKKEELESASTEELRSALGVIDALIENPSSGLTTIWTHTEGDKTVVIEEGEPLPADASPADPDRFLNSRREFIVRRLAVQVEEERAELERERLDAPDDEQIEKTLARLDEEAARVNELRLDAESRREEQELARQLQMARFQLEAEERRSGIARLEQLAEAEAKRRWWETRLGRDSVAAIVGGVLLIGLALAVVVAMFTDTATTDVVQNAFLLILGYFFGAAIGSRPVVEGTDSGSAQADS